MSERPTRPLAALLWTLTLGGFWMLIELARVLASGNLVDPVADVGKFLGYLPWQLAVFACIGAPLAALVRWVRVGSELVSWLRLGAALWVFLGPSTALGAYRISREPLLALAAALGSGALIAGLVAFLVLVGRLLPRLLRDAWPAASVIASSFVLVPFMSRASAPLRLGSLRFAELAAMTRPWDWAAAGIALVVALGLVAWRRQRAGGASVRAIALFACVFGSGPTRAETVRVDVSPPLPDIVVILIDAMRADALDRSRQGPSLTPNLDAIAAESIVFERAYSAANRTARSMPAIMTSLSVPVVGEVLSPRVRTLAEYLQGAGFATYGISTNPHVSQYYGYDQGFDRLRDPTVAPDYLVMNPLKILGQTFPAAAYHWGVISARLYYATASEVRSRAVRLLRDAGRPLFLYLHMMDLHGPYLPPKRFLPPDYQPADFVSYFELLEHPSKGDVDARYRRTLENARQRYDGELRFVDQEIGRLVETLRRAGRWEETLVWVLSDHGEAFGEHAWVGHSGNNVFSTLLHVPMILKPPRSYSFDPAVVEVPVSTFDLLPTTLSLLGLEPSEPVFGKSLVDLERRAPRIAPAPVISDSYHPEGRLISGIEGSWQLVAFVPKETGVAELQALFSLEGDPTSRENQLAQRPEVARRLAESIRARLADERRLSTRAATPATDARIQEMLQSLGYVEE